MPLSAVHKGAVEETINFLLNATGPRGKRKICDMFRELPDRADWVDYYNIIPQPRSMHLIQEKLRKNSYRNVLDVYEDLNLVFLNAMYYNEEGSQIWKDANTLKNLLDNEWRHRSSVLPLPRESPPPSSAQKIHRPALVAAAQPPSAAPTPIPTPISAPAPTLAAPPAAPPKRSTPSAPTASRPIPILPKSPPRPPSPEVEIDVGGGSSDHEPIEEVPRDEQSEEIVKQLEKSLPGWPGFSEQGWMPETSDVRDLYLDLVLAIKNHKDVVTNNRPSMSLEAIPEDWPIPNTPYNDPISLKSIESRSRSKLYPSTKAFDMDMSILFMKGRRWYEPGSEKYGHIILLQRLYQALTSSSPPEGPPYVSATHFASLRAGPGTARPLHAAPNNDDNEGVPGVTTFRVSVKDRRFVHEVHYKGWSFRLADWVHMANPDDPSRPVVAQVFKCWVSEDREKKGQPGLTVCWYNRPEQTIHPGHRQFWEGEVFKTSHFADHPLEDIIEKIACQFTARHVRGRPRPPFWYPGWPLYVCDSRYNDRDRCFVKIKNWNSCIPDEVRKNPDFMPIYPFERTVFPRRFGSPFLLKGKPIKGPGGIGEPLVKQQDADKPDTPGKRPRRTGTHSIVDQTGPNKGLYVGTPGAQPSTVGTSTSHSHYPPSQQVQLPQLPVPPARPSEDRSIVTAAGGWANLANNAVAEKIPPETAKHFDRDPETNELLWFSGPPINVSHAPGPQYSLAYLHFLAKKRKAAQENEVDEASKRRKPAPRTATEIVNSVLSDGSIA
ncbi:hypothetical protein OE88DRAFT_1635762 [Heliocybe sulcata]|uniref:Bromodomain-containing protein n=1 Tax=Heliocybe sulcata TaxID=5364 RepID=A0A5C3MRB3_9AGAM|nr:hypothetical protein OE88DRAFT_1635762 [Heliocybe sulcata]